MTSRFFFRVKSRCLEKGATTKDAITGAAFDSCQKWPSRWREKLTKRQRVLFFTFPRSFLWKNYTFDTRMCNCLVCRTA